MKKYITVFLLLWLTCWCAMAQQLSVSSFECMPTDLDARVTYPVRDHNGKTCALIKVENINTGFQFATGTLSIPKVEQKAGEIWVYVQPGVQKMTISHSSLGILRDYRFPESIKEATVYVMKLESGQVHTYVEQAPQGAYLTMRLTPTNAVVWIDDEMQTTEDGAVMAYLNNGEHTYRVQAVGYSQEVGKVEIKGERKDMKVVLQSNKAVLKLSCADARADLYLDGKKVGVGQWHGEVIPGTHVIEVMRNGHRSQTRQVQLEEREQSMQTFEALTPINGYLQISSRPIDTEVWLDGKKVGTTPYGPEKTLVGTHQLELCKVGYQTLKKDIVITEGETCMVNNPLEKEVVKNDDSTVFDKVEVLPSFPGGQATLLKWLSDNIKYPASCAEDGIQGRVYAQFIVNTDGSISDIKIIRSPNSELSKETERVLKIMPKWNPGKQLGKPVRVKYSLPVRFKLPESNTSTVENQSFTVNGASFKMVKVEGGTFRMGGTAEQGSDAKNNEKPVHNVTLSPYYIGSTEVTQALWQAVMGKNPSHFSGDNHPVENVSWNDCQKFIQKLNSLTGRTFRLPTEAEWEYAARGGNRSKGYKYSGSNNIEEVAWYKNNSGGKTHSVGSKQPNELGIYDMSGNVWEWCSDWYGFYSSTSQTDPKGSSNGSSQRVYRGGCWYIYNARICRVSHRSYSTPDTSYNFLGLRLCLSPVR